MKHLLPYLFLLWSVAALSQPYTIKHNYLFAPLVVNEVTRDITDAYTGCAGTYSDSVCVITVTITNTAVTAMVASKTNFDFVIDWGKTTIAIDSQAPEACSFIGQPGCVTHITSITSRQFKPIGVVNDIFPVRKQYGNLPEEDVAANIGRKIIITLNGEFNGKPVSYRLPFQITSFQVN